VPHLSYEQGALGAIAIAAGLLGRQGTGLGRVVTVSGLHAVSVLNATILVDVPGSVRPFGGAKAGLAGGASFRVYQCRDGLWLFIAALGPHFFMQALDSMGLHGLLDLPGVEGDFARTRDPQVQALIARSVEDRMRERDRRDWQAVLDRAGVPNAPVEQREDWMRSETVAANQGLITRPHADLGPVILPGILAKLSATPGRVDHLADSDAFVDPAAVWADVPAYPAQRPGAGPDRAEQALLPLAGLTVLDLGSFQAGPIASDILGDFGASVVKVEHPAGDGFRSAPSAYTAMNKGKRNLSIDLKEGGALNLLLALVRQSDVVIDNTRVGIPERLGTDYEALRQVNPNIVRCTILGWGEGPFREAPSFDPLFQARSGLMAVQGAGGDPVWNAMPVHDVGVGTLGAFGVLAALFARRLVGRGQEVTTSLTHASLMQQAGEMTSFPGSPSAPLGGTDYLGPSPARRLYHCQDGWIAVSGETEGVVRLRASLSDATGTAGDSDGSGDADLEWRFLGLTVGAALDALTAAAIPAVNVLGRNDVFQDRWLGENHFFAPVDDAEHGPMMIVAGYSDWGCPRAPERGRSHALGADAEAILRDLDPARSKGGVQ
jgi:crotonobetainyl-CoA:carnitine CoA-transferase CaiB-like acyl-CoA transferase